MDTEADLLSVPTALNDDICTAGPGTDNQDDLSCKFSWFSEINRMHDPATLSIPQPFVRSSISRPHRELGIVIASDRHYQVIEMPRNPRAVLQIMCQGVIEGDDLFPRPVC